MQSLNEQQTHTKNNGERHNSDYNSQLFI